MINRNEELNLHQDFLVNNNCWYATLGLENKETTMIMPMRTLGTISEIIGIETFM